MLRAGPILLLVCSLLGSGEAPLAYRGSSTVYPLVVAGAVVSGLMTAGTPGGSLAGFRALAAGQGDVVGASRAMEPSEAEACAKAGVRFVEVPLAYDGVSIVTNTRNAFLKSLTMAELRTIWSPGGPLSWRQVRPDMPDEPIRLFAPGTDSATREFFVERVLGSAQAPLRADLTASEDDNALVQGISAVRGALGVIGHAYLSDNTQVLRAVAVDAGEGPQSPTMEGITNGAYPLSRPLFLYLPLASPRQATVRALSAHLIDHPELVAEVGYVAMPDTVRGAARARLLASTPGSVMATRPGTSVAAAFSAP